jgi:glyoxylase-like metal-dependent hydrolase (beta-lactamase superfamily II)
MIHVLDLGYQDIAEAIAAFVVQTEIGPVLVETGPHSTLPHLQAELAKLDIRAEDIQHVFLTHIHLDHAGAAWWFAQRGATIYVHPRGKKHLHAPERLWESAKLIYQDDMERLWGEIEGIPEAQMYTPEDGEVISIGGVDFETIYSPGHAVHHIAWGVGEYIFTGDVGGVKVNDGPVVPPCPPPDIHLEDWLNSLDRLREKQARRFYLTHFGPVENTDAHLDELANRLRTYVDWMEPYAKADTPQAEILPEFTAFVRKDLSAAGLNEAELHAYEAANPPWMSVAGLIRYWKKYRLAE